MEPFGIPGVSVAASANLNKSTTHNDDEGSQSEIGSSRVADMVGGGSPTRSGVHATWRGHMVGDDDRNPGFKGPCG